MSGNGIFIGRMHASKYWQIHLFLRAQQTDVIFSPQHTWTFHRQRLSLCFVLAAVEGFVRTFHSVRERCSLPVIALQAKAHLACPDFIKHFLLSACSGSTPHHTTHTANWSQSSHGKSSYPDSARVWTETPLTTRWARGQSRMSDLLRNKWLMTGTNIAEADWLSGCGFMSSITFKRSPSLGSSLCYHWPWSPVLSLNGEVGALGGTHWNQIIRGSSPLLSV